MTATDLNGFRPDAEGKVRQIYDLGDGRLLLVATDRISAYDVVLPDLIPNKGRVLTQMSEFWLRKIAGIVPNHLFSTNVTDLPAEFLGKLTDSEFEELKGRIMIVAKAQVLPVECIVRGYITGSGWESYQRDGTVCGIALPSGLEESEKLPQPIFTPSTKAALGAHDENISFERLIELVGPVKATMLRSISIALYNKASEHARQQGIILADTKFEFGIFDGEIILIDEVLTPDSSRFWPADGYEPGKGQPSFDKQFVRDYLTRLVKAGKWNKEAPGPNLPTDVVEQTAAKYVEAYERITGTTFPF